MNVVFSDTKYPHIIEGMCRWAGPLIGAGFNPERTAGIAVLGDHGAGTVLYTEYHPQTSIVMHAAGKGNWLTRETLAIFFGYPFHDLELRRITTYVARRNKVARAFNSKLGFIQEGCLRKAAETGDHLMVYGMLNHECRWLRDREEKEAA